MGVLRYISIFFLIFLAIGFLDARHIKKPEMSPRSSLTPSGFSTIKSIPAFNLNSTQQPNSDSPMEIPAEAHQPEDSEETVPKEMPATRFFWNLFPNINATSSGTSGTGGSGFPFPDLGLNSGLNIIG